MAAFEELGLMTEIAKAVEELEWQLPTDIQAEAIPLILGGGDVLMAAETGSGKTGAFCLPVLQIVFETLYNSSKKKVENPDFSNDIHLSLNDRHQCSVISSNFLECQSKEANLWAGIRTNKGVTRNASEVNSNKFYYEIHFTESGLARVGWSLANASLDLGTDRFGYGYGGTAKKSNSRQFDNYGETFGDRNDVIGCCIDLDTCKISYSKNGKNMGVAFNLDKKLCDEEIFFPTICTKNARCSVRFIPDANFKTDPPKNFKWIGNCLKSCQVVNNPNIQSKTNKSKNANGPKAIILEPSRELAEQTLKCISSFKKYLPDTINEYLILGGVNVKEQMQNLTNRVDIIVATPHRLDDLVINNYISLNDCRFFIIDEVDALLQQNNFNIIMNLYSKMPKMFEDGKRLQLIACSATLHNFEVKKLADKLMYFPSWVDLKGEDSVPDTVHHTMLKVDPRKMSNYLNMDPLICTDAVHKKDLINFNNYSKESLSEAVKLIKGRLVIKAIDSLKIEQAIIFCRTKIDCDNLENYMKEICRFTNKPINTYSCVCLHGDRSPAERNANLDKFKNNKCKFLICTDVAARGIDIKGVPFVINVTLPDEKSNYLHRIGRVGRADRMGLAISLVSVVPEKVWYHSCSSRGKSCNNTNLKQQGGCCIWYNELELLGEVEEHLKCTIQEITDSFQIETNEFDGKVVYGAKKLSNHGFNYENHAEELKNVVQHLTTLETQSQINFLTMSDMKRVKV